MLVDWHTLKLGDSVVVACWPPELCRDNLHKETLDLYDWLIESGTALVIVRFDHLKLPYGKIVRNELNGQASHYLALNHGGLKYSY
jgi:hypothetical protein